MASSQMMRHAMVAGFLAFHQIAAQRGDGLRPELVEALSRSDLGGTQPPTPLLQIAKGRLHNRNSGHMSWKPIAELTEADLEIGWMHRLLVLWNSCDGAHHYSPAEEAGDIKREGVWEMFLVLPEVSLTDGRGY